MPARFVFNQNFTTESPEAAAAAASCDPQFHYSHMKPNLTSHRMCRAVLITELTKTWSSYVTSEAFGAM
jgi:hypothetical protein